MIGSDNKLSIDADKFKAADWQRMYRKILFNKNGALRYQTSQMRPCFHFMQSAASQASTYGANGTYTYNYQSGNLYDTGI